MEIDQKRKPSHEPFNYPKKSHGPFFFSPFDARPPTDEESTQPISAYTFPPFYHFQKCGLHLHNLRPIV